MNLVLNEASKVEFSLVIAGTQMKPSEVRVVLGSGPKLSFTAQTEDGINYSAIVTPLRDVVSSICLFTVEVLFGEKIFVPIRRQITLTDSTPVIQVFDKETVANNVIEPTSPAIEPTVPAPEVQMAIQPEVEIEIEENKPTEIIHVEEVKQPADTLVEQKIKEQQLLKIFEVTAKKAPIEKKEIFISPAKNPFADKKYKQKITLPKLVEAKPVGIETNSAKVTKSIFAEEDKTPKAKKSTNKKQVVIEHQFPIKIEKTDVIYR